MKELRISVTVKKTIQEAKFEPYTLELTLEDAIRTPSERESAITRLRREAERLLASGIEERARRAKLSKEIEK